MDLDKLISTRLLIAANSGGGKSWTIRKLLEESHGNVQHIILDIEGEFSTLREKYDYVLVGDLKQGADIQASVKTAEILARKVLELNVSVIIDLYELKHYDRLKFARIFLDALVNAPKELRHPCIVVVDEAHSFCPEKGKGESEASSSVIELATKGRKRGLCAILATQRLAKLNKDAAAEMGNKLIGRTVLDVDRKRAGEELGFTSKEDMLGLRDLDPGEFFAFGTAISKDIIRAKIGPVKTSHPQIGQKSYEAPRMTEAIKQVLTKLTDIPFEAERELKDKQDMMRRIRELEAELRSKKVQLKENESIITNENLERIRNVMFKSGQDSMITDMKTNKKLFYGIAAEIEKIEKATLAAKEILNKVPDVPKDTIMSFAKMPFMVKVKDVQLPQEMQKIQRQIETYSKPNPVMLKMPQNVEIGEEKPFGRCEREILKVLSSRPDFLFSKAQLAALSGYSIDSGGFNNSLASLNSRGLIARTNSRLRIKLDEIERVKEILGEEFGNVNENPIQEWLQKLDRCERLIFDLLIKNPDDLFSKSQIAESTGYMESSGGFNNALAHLNSLELLKREEGSIRLNPELKEWIY